MRVMRTTVSIDDEILKSAKDEAAAKAITLSRLVEEALQRFLATPEIGERPPIPTFKGGTGLRPGIDPTSNRSLRAAADEDLPRDKLR